MSASNHYDVIIIGTGAGGGTLARHLAPSGKRILLLERGDWLPREPSNWSAQDVFVDGRYVSPDTWYDAKGKAFQPQIHYFVGGATKLYGAALYRLRREDFGELRHHDGLSPAWPISYDDMEPYYTLAEQLYQVHGAHGEDPTEPPASAPYPHPALSHEPRIQQLSDDLAAAGYHPFHAPCGVMLDEANMPYSTCVRCAFCDGFPCPLHAKSDAEVHGVRPALEHPNVTLLTNATAVRLDTNPAGTAVTEVVVDHDGERRGLHRRCRGGLLRRRQHRQAAAGVGQRPAPPRPGQRLRPGRTQLRVPQQPGRAGPLPRTEPDGVPEDPRRQRLLLRHRRLRIPDGQHPDGRQVDRGDVPGREAHRDQARAHPGPQRHRHPRRRLLAVDRGPAPPRQPGHPRTRRQHQAQLRGWKPGRQRPPLPPAQVDARPPRHAPGPPHPASTPTSRPTSPSPAAPTRPAPAASGPIPRPRCSTSTAVPTRSTTCTSSTPASSRASAP